MSADPVLWCEQKQESGAELATPAGAVGSNSGTPATAAAPLFADTPAGPAQPSGWDEVYEGADDGAHRLQAVIAAVPTVAACGAGDIQQQHLCTMFMRQSRTRHQSFMMAWEIYIEQSQRRESRSRGAQMASCRLRAMP